MRCFASRVLTLCLVCYRCRDEFGRCVVAMLTAYTRRLQPANACVRLRELARRPKKHLTRATPPHLVPAAFTPSAVDERQFSLVRSSNRHEAHGKGTGLQVPSRWCRHSVATLGRDGPALHPGWRR